MVNSQSAADHLEWCGFVESKVRYLVSNLERNHYISLAHVNPKCFERSKQQLNAKDETIAADATGTADATAAVASATATTTAVPAAFCSMWFIGLEFRKTENLNVDLTENIQNFTNLVHKHSTSSGLQKNGMEFEVRHVRRKQLSTYLDKEILNLERKKRDSSATATEANSRKRTSAEVTASTTNAEPAQPQQNESEPEFKRQKTNDNVSTIEKQNIAYVHRFIIICSSMET